MENYELLEQEKKLEGRTINNYYFEKIIGRGSYGCVFQAICMHTRERVAIKHCPNLFNDLLDAKRILRELCILIQVSHRSIVELLDVFEPDNEESFNELFIVMQLMRTDVKKAVKRQCTFDIKHVQYTMYRMLKGTEYLHKRGVVHRDIKPANILLSEQCEVKICDFGLARTISTRRLSFSSEDTEVKGFCAKYLQDNNENEGTQNRSLDNIEDVDNEPILSQNPEEAMPIKLPSADLKMQSRKISEEEKTEQILTDDEEEDEENELSKHMMTRYYRAPEVIMINNYDFKVDMWSIGCVFAELLGLLKGSVHTGPLFPGESCYPMSPSKKNKTKNGDEPPTIGTDDQFYLIVSTMGRPDEEQLSFLKSPHQVNYIMKFSEFEGVNLADAFPTAPLEAIDLLYRMLEFNPDKRISAEEAAKHIFFSDMDKSGFEVSADEKPVECIYDKMELDDEDNLKMWFMHEISSFKYAKYRKAQ